VIPRIVDVSESGKYISKNRGFLSIKGEDSAEQTPLDDIGVLMISAYGATLTKDALVSIAERGGVTILAGQKGLPSALVLPVNAHCETALRTRLQAGASLPLKKRIWQAIVQAKLRAQAGVLRFYEKPDTADRIERYAKDVASGDTKNREASGARVYWRALFGEGFIREPDNPAVPNSLLNYGYAVLRASVARAICASGLSPVFGIQHKSSVNPFPLADDIMEPFRPLVDFYVKKAVLDGLTELNAEAKQAITRFIWADLHFNGENTPFFAALERLAFSLVASFKSKKPLVEIASLRF
jgi:CRISPR-associated protein Cas1